MTEATMIPFREAFVRFALAERLNTAAAENFDYFVDGGPIVEYHAGDHVVDGPLRPYDHDRTVCGRVVGGTLEVRGPILDESSDDSTFFLLTGGDLVVEHLVAGASAPRSPAARWRGATPYSGTGTGISRSAAPSRRSGW